MPSPARSTGTISGGAAALRAEGHANTDLTGPLRRGVGNHAIDPDHAEQVVEDAQRRVEDHRPDQRDRHDVREQGAAGQRHDAGHVGLGQSLGREQSAGDGCRTDRRGYGSDHRPLLLEFETTPARPE